MELRQLKYFIAVAETKSLSNAVKRLFIAQPALSQSIKTLEDELETKLFVRSRKGMALTTAGQGFLENAKLILREVDRSKEGIRDAAENPSGLVSIAIAPSASSVLSVPLYREVKNKYPNIILNIEEHTALDVSQCFDTGAFDLLVYFRTENVENIEIEPIIQEELYLACQYSKKHPLPLEINFSDLSMYPLMFPQVSTNVDKKVSEIAYRNKVDVRVQKDTVAIRLLIKLVKEGLANSVVPWTMIYDSVKANEVMAAKIVNPPVTRTLNLISPTNRHQTHATQVAMQLIRETATRQNEEGEWRGNLLLKS